MCICCILQLPQQISLELFKFSGFELTLLDNGPDYFQFIKEIESLDFIQIHKSLIINKNVIKKIFKEHNNYYALLINNEILPVSRLRFKEICKII